MHQGFQMHSHESEKIIDKIYICQGAKRIYSTVARLACQYLVLVELIDFEVQNEE